MIVATAVPAGPGVHTTVKPLAVGLVGAAQLPLVSATAVVKGRSLPLTVKVVATPEAAVSGVMLVTLAVLPDGVGVLVVVVEVVPVPVMVKVAMPIQ